MDRLKMLYCISQVRVSAARVKLLAIYRSSLSDTFRATRDKVAAKRSRVRARSTEARKTAVHYQR